MERSLSNKDIRDMGKLKTDKIKWDGIDRRKAIGSSVDPYHERRKDGQRNVHA